MQRLNAVMPWVRSLSCWAAAVLWPALKAASIPPALATDGVNKVTNVRLLFLGLRSLNRNVCHAADDSRHRSELSAEPLTVFACRAIPSRNQANLCTQIDNWGRTNAGTARSMPGAAKAYIDVMELMKAHVRVRRACTRPAVAAATTPKSRPRF